MFDVTGDGEYDLLDMYVETEILTNDDDSDDDDDE